MSETIDLNAMTKDELKVLGKEHKIKSWNLLGETKLRAALHDKLGSNSEPFPENEDGASDPVDPKLPAGAEGADDALIIEGDDDAALTEAVKAAEGDEEQEPEEEEQEADDAADPAPEAEESVKISDVAVLVKSAVAEALVAQRNGVSSEEAMHQGVESSLPVNEEDLIESEDFVRVRVQGTFRSRLNQHVKGSAPYDVIINMPVDFNRGDLKRSLPIKLAPLYPTFVGHRSADSYEVIGPVFHAEGEKPKSDMIEKTVRGFKNSARFLEDKEEKAISAADESTGLEIEISDEEKETGLPAVINDE